MQRDEILRSYGTDYKNMTKALLEAGGAAADIRFKCGLASQGDKAGNANVSLAGAQDGLSSRRRLRIGIKPNLVCPTPADFGGTTHPEIVAGIIEYLTEHGFGPDEIEILEGSWVGDRTEDAFEYCGYNSLSLKYGVQLRDMQKEHETISCNCTGLSLNICSHALDFDYLVNVPVIKGHCQT